MLFEVKKLANGFLLGHQGEMPMYVKDVTDLAEAVHQLCNEDVEMKEYLPSVKRRNRRSSKRARANKTWSEEEDLKLISLFENHEKFGRIALELGRSVSATRQRASYHGLTNKSKALEA